MKKLLIVFMMILFLFMTSCSKKQDSVKAINTQDNEAAINDNKETIDDMDNIMNDIDSMINDVSREDINIDVR